MATILSTKCEHCAYGSINELNKARIKIKCSMKNKEYYYGQYIPCDYFEPTEIEVESEEQETEFVSIDVKNENQSENKTNDESIRPIKRKRGRPKGSKNKKPRK